MMILKNITLSTGLSVVFAPDKYQTIRVVTQQTTYVITKSKGDGHVVISADTKDQEPHCE